MDLGIENRVAIVTGASAGIGFAVAEELLDNGASVFIVARDAGRLRVVGHPSKQCRTSTCGRFDVVFGSRLGRNDCRETDVHAADVQGSDPSYEGEAVGPHCEYVVHGGIYPNPKLFISHVLSASINNLTKSLALEVAADGILVNAIGIGAVATDNWASNMIPAVRRNRPEMASLTDEEVIARISAELTPVGRAGTPKEMAAIAAFLASERNGFVTGDTIEASGGADRFMQAVALREERRRAFGSWTGRAHSSRRPLILRSWTHWKSAPHA